MADSDLPIISVETNPSSLQATTPLYLISLQASFIALFTSSTVVFLLRTKVISEIEPVITGTRKALPSNKPLSCGTASVVAAAAPVVVGIIFTYAALALLKSLALKVYLTAEP